MKYLILTSWDGFKIFIPLASLQTMLEREDGKTTIFAGNKRIEVMESMNSIIDTIIEVEDREDILITDVCDSGLDN